MHTHLKLVTKTCLGTESGQASAVLCPLHCNFLNAFTKLYISLVFPELHFTGLCGFKIKNKKCFNLLKYKEP